MREAFRKLNIDEREQLADLLGEPAWRPFLKLLDGMAAEAEQKIVKHTVDSIQASDELLRLKLRAEGARSLARDIALLPEHIRRIEKKEQQEG